MAGGKVRAEEEIEVEAPLMTVPEVAQFLSVSRETVYKMARSGVIPSFRVGGGWRFSKGAIAKWLAGDSHAGAHDGGR